MRKWTDKQQQQLDELLKAKEHARARLQDDIDHLLDRTAGGIGGPVSEYLMAYGQDVLDMLIVHFEPTTLVPIVPLGTIAKQVQP